MPHTIASADSLAPIVGSLAALRASQGEARVHGVAPEILTGGGIRWVPATRYVDGTALPSLLDAAVRRWLAPRHVAAALAWKQYTYWLLLPPVLGYAVAGRVPDMSATNVLVRREDDPALVRLGLVAPRVAAGPDEAARLALFRRGVLDEHLGPMLEQLRGLAHVGRRTLLGSIASAVCHILVRAQPELPGDIRPTAATLLDALGVADLAELTPDLGVQRRTCCLAFTLPTSKICDGCCIRHP